MIDKSLREKAILLRVQDRLSYPEILEKVPVSKGTLSLWLREFPLTPEETKARQQANAEHARTVRLAGVSRGPSGDWSTRPDLSKSDLGEACRQMISAKLIFQGVSVFHPLTEDTPIDLVILTKSGRFLKCQCKCIFRTSGKRSHTMNLTSIRKWGPNSKAVAHKYTANEVDLFLGYCVDNDGVYVIPLSEVGGKSSLTFWITSDSYLDSKLNQKWLNAFELLA